MKRAPRAQDLCNKLIHDKHFIDLHKRGLDSFTRYRKLPFATVVATLTHLCKRSLQIECNLLGDILDMQQPASKQAFSKARYKISYTGFEALHEESLKVFYNDNSTGLWHGYRVLGVDGSTSRLPESEDTEAYFGRWDRGGGDRPGKQPINGRVSEIVDLTCGLIVSGRIVPWRISEHTLAHEQILEVTNRMRSWQQEKLLYIFDRGYPSKLFIDQFLELGVDFVFRIPRGFNKKIDAFIQGKEKDCLLNLYTGHPPYRVLKKTLSSGERAVLLTSLTDKNKHSRAQLFRVYSLRWTGCEEGYKLQKISLEFENFIGKAVEAVLQEFWATLLAANLLSMHCIDTEGPRRVENPVGYRINRNVIMGSMREDMLRVLTGQLSPSDFQIKFDRLAARVKVKIRPGRCFSREGVGKPKRHHVPRRVC